MEIQVIDKENNLKIISSDEILYTSVDKRTGNHVIVATMDSEYRLPTQQEVNNYLTDNGLLFKADRGIAINPVKATNINLERRTIVFENGSETTVSASKIKTAMELIESK